MMRRLKIVSDGTVLGTRVHDADTGEDLSYGVDAVRVEIDLYNGPRAWLSFPETAIDVVAAQASDVAGEGFVYAQREDRLTIVDGGA